MLEHLAARTAALEATVIQPLLQAAHLVQRTITHYHMAQPHVLAALIRHPHHQWQLHIPDARLTLIIIRT